MFKFDHTTDIFSDGFVEPTLLYSDQSNAGNGDGASSMDAVGGYGGDPSSPTSAEAQFGGGLGALAGGAMSLGMGNPSGAVAMATGIGAMANGLQGMGPYGGPTTLEALGVAAGNGLGLYESASGSDAVAAGGDGTGGGSIYAAWGDYWAYMGMSQNAVGAS